MANSSLRVIIFALIASSVLLLVAGRCTDKLNVVFSNTRKSASGSTYARNVDLLFDRLITTTGYDRVGSSSNRVYGFSECYGSSSCRACLVSAKNAIKSAAPRAIGARICKATCYLRYENYVI